MKIPIARAKSDKTLQKVKEQSIQNAKSFLCFNAIRRLMLDKNKVIIL